MGGLVRTLLAGALGGVVMYYLPRLGVLAATQEIIGFLALLMAGLLPAMTVTATVLRGEGISAKRVDEYAGALRLQMRFWGALFAAAACSTLGIVIIKIFAADKVHVVWEWRGWRLDEGDFVTFGIVFAGAGLGVVLARLYPAYQGLVSLLELNATMARIEAIARDRTARDAFSFGLSGIENPAEYQRPPLDQEI